jgi:hypothetical protein
VKLVVRSADCESDSAPLLKLLQEQLSPSTDQRRFDWLYKLCPFGEARVWVAMDPDSGKLAGAAAAFPRRIRIGDRIELGCVFGDFCVSPEHRSLGPAIQLQRKCLDSVMNGEFAAAYDLPSASMVAVYRRLGAAPGGQLVRMTKLLRSNARIATKIKPRLVADGLSVVVNAVLSLKRGSLQSRTGATLQKHTGRFGSEFTELALRIGSRLGNCVERSAEYLNWRYVDHPQQQYEVLTAHRHGLLEGYLIFQIRGTDANVVDWFGDPADLRADLVRGLIATLRSREAEAIHVPVLSSHSVSDELMALGFRPRESSPVVFVEPMLGHADSTQTNTAWLLLDGDRES